MANQFYCKHCGKQIDADSAFCMHCGGAINSNNKTTPQANKQDVSFIRQLDILGGKFLIGINILGSKFLIGIINILKWCGRTIVNFGKFIKRPWMRILIFILGIAGAILLIYLGEEEVEEYRAIFMVSAILLIILTLYFSCSKSIKLILPSSILLLCSYGAFIYNDHEHIYGSNTTFFDTVKREFYWITPHFTIPDHATSIENNAFYDCDGLRSITIPNSVTSIGAWAFYKCSRLINLTIPYSVTLIGDYAFHKCSNLSSVTIGSSVTSIGGYAFCDCDDLRYITIPNSVTSIGDLAFYGCTSLESVYCKATTPPTGGNRMFLYYNYNYGYKPIGCKIYVPRNSVEAYKSAEGWRVYADDIVGYYFF